MLSAMDVTIEPEVIPTKKMLLKNGMSQMQVNELEVARGMIEDCMNVIGIPESRGGPGFNSWERRFIESVETQINQGYCSAKQYATLEKLWNKI